MLSTLFRHVRHNAAGYVALFAALGGTSYAAVQIPSGSVGTPQLRNGAVTATKVKAHSLLAADFAGGQLPSGAQGARGAVGPQGLPGATGPEGARGPAGPQGPDGLAGARGSNGSTGPQGPEGPAGAQGPAGAEGPAGAQGPKGDSGTAHTALAQNTTVVQPGADVVISATCPAGTTVTGGGFLAAAGLQAEESSPDLGNNAWVLEVKNPSSSVAVQTFVQAVCAS